ncbi:MAG: endo-1,4-beta-xylanase [Phycisphaerae bacterium]|nr:endo-1,4-beta-xylanase [Phycisphaerae bacterium]
MLRFTAYRDGAVCDQIDLSGAYAFGQDGIPVRADLVAEKGQVTCVKRVAGAIGLAVLWDVPGVGRYLLPTTRLPDRRRPYNLNLELARAQLLRIARKREDWGLFDYAEAEALGRRFDEVRRMFVEALKSDDPPEAARRADKALARAVTLGEKTSLFHADIFVRRRRMSQASAAQSSFGCAVDLFSEPHRHHKRLSEAFDFVSVPMPWKHVEPDEGRYDYARVDAWINWAARAGKPVHGGPVLSFAPEHVPEWLYIWEHDYETIRDMIYEHLQQTVRRYAGHVAVWKVISGIHAYNGFDMSFEQIRELTRMSCLWVRKLAPQAKIIIELVVPWSEYYAHNQRTIPSLLYADTAVQYGVNFDAFGLQVLMGAADDGYYVRDLLQISSLLDEFVSLGKPVHVTACQVPSATAPDAWDAWGGKAAADRAGTWHMPWSERLQAEWLQAFYRISISKPFVESICWRDLADYEGHCLPHGGLCRNDLAGKLAYRELRNFRAFLASASSAAGTPPAPKS